MRLLTTRVGKRPLRSDRSLVSRRALVPIELTRGPFTLHEARSAGVSPSALRSTPWKRVGKAMYSWEHASSDPWLLLAAWWRALGPAIAFGGYTAAWMHGLDCRPVDPVEVIAPALSSARSCGGLVVRHSDLDDDAVVNIRRFRVTSLLRTVRDLCVSRPAVDALVVIDMAVRLRLADAVSLWRHAQDAAGLPGSARLRRLARLAEPAESPMETRLRWLLLEAGLPRPVVQKDLRDADGRFVCRADLYYPTAGLVVEFDGGNHRERLVSDDRRQYDLVNAGYTVLRFTSAYLRTRPGAVVAHVRGALASANHFSRFVQNMPNAVA